MRALRSPAVRRACAPTVIGDTAALRRAGWTPALCPLLPEDARGRLPARPGPSAAGGEASLHAVTGAWALLKSRAFDGLVTAPVSKESWALAGAPAPAHTDLFRLLGGKEPLMAFSRGRANAALVTEHLPVRRLSGALTKALIKEKASLFAAALKARGFRAPRLAVCALNPHAGDGGVIGREELDVIAPALKELSRGGLRVKGPLPSDAAWADHLAGGSDGLLCLYHDQALAPLKLAPLAGPAVHWTWGLPFPRTSPAHGTAFDIAGRGRADAAGMIAAILSAAQLAGGGRK